MDTRENENETETEVDASTGETVPKRPAAVVEIEKWFVEHFHGSIVSRDTEVYNHVLKAKNDLIARFSK